MLSNIEESNTQLNSLVDSLTEKIKSGQLDMNQVSTSQIKDGNKNDRKVYFNGSFAISCVGSSHVFFSSNTIMLTTRSQHQIKFSAPSSFDFSCNFLSNI